MIRRKPRRRARLAFTLIELLVVIAIIAILVSLTAAAVMKVLGKGPELQTRVEIGQIDAGIGNAKAALNNVLYIPSRLYLREDSNYDMTNRDQARTATWLQQAFGKRAVTPGTFVDWNGDGTQNGPWLLNGSQCLVFVLGGINGVQGFSTNPMNPAAPGGTRKGPFFEFKQNRLVAGPVNGFLQYVDYYGKNQPYVYMSSYSAGNDYNNSSNGGSDGPFNPYSSNGRFINANGFQIISAGADGQFGPGGNWNTATGWVSGPGFDDQANFSAGLLGVPQR